jgi:hypothetical protein
MDRRSDFSRSSTYSHDFIRISWQGTLSETDMSDNNQINLRYLLSTQSQRVIVADAATMLAFHDQGEL